LNVFGVFFDVRGRYGVGASKTQLRMHEVLRIAAAAGITLAVIGLSILFFEWVFY
jgi:hypothetical protein